MNQEMFIRLIDNTVLLIVLSMIYTIFPVENVKFSLMKKIFFGIAFGLIGIAMMTKPFQLEPGIIFDVRAVLVSLAGMFLGLIPTAITVVATSIFRIYHGGIGALSGIIEIIF